MYECPPPPPPPDCVLPNCFNTNLCLDLSLHVWAQNTAAPFFPLANLPFFFCLLIVAQENCVSPAKTATKNAEKTSTDEKSSTDGAGGIDENSSPPSSSATPAGEASSTSTPKTDKEGEEKKPAGTPEEAEATTDEATGDTDTASAEKVNKEKARVYRSGDWELYSPETIFAGVVAAWGRGFETLSYISAIPQLARVCVSLPVNTFLLRSRVCIVACQRVKTARAVLLPWQRNSLRVRLL